MSDIYQALQDVRWLSQRLKGLIALSEEIESYDNLKQQSSEMDKAIHQKKDEYQKLEVELGNLKDERRVAKERFEMSLSDQKTKVDAVLADANNRANQIFEKAKKDAEAIRAAVEQERQAYLLKNRDLETTSLSLSKEVNAKQKQLEELTASIDKLRAKF